VTDFKNPPKYLLEQNQFNVITHISSKDETISANLEKYVAGVYVQYRTKTFGADTV